MSEVYLALIRHAHRDTTNRSIDNGLSSKGRTQAESLKDFFIKRYGKISDVQMHSSPKLRCKETLEPLAIALGVTVDVEKRLSEQAAEESIGDFSKRLNAYFDKIIKEKKPLTLACSHGDWIPEAVLRFTKRRIDCKKGSWALLKLVDGKTWEWTETIAEP